MKFLHNLDYLLHINKMSRAELARKIEIAPSTINAWYTKDYKGITLKNLVKLSKCFEVTIEDLVNGDINALFFTSDNYTESELKEELKGFKYYLDNQADEDRKKTQARDNEISVIVQAIKKKERALDNCCELLEDGVYTREQYFKRVNILTEERDALQANLEALRANSEDKSESVRSAVPILEKCIEQYYNLSIPDRNKVLKSIIERIEYTRTDPTRRAPFKLKIFLKI